MRWHTLPKTCNRKMPVKAALPKKDEGAAHPFRPGIRYSTRGRIHFAQTNSVFFLFRLQNGGGPYIPVCRSTAHYIHRQLSIL